eukprot:3855320-Pleurochrysis_carterae.AAC.2
MSSRSSRRATRARFASCARWTVCSSGTRSADATPPPGRCMRGALPLPACNMHATRHLLHVFEHVNCLASSSRLAQRELPCLLFSEKIPRPMIISSLCICFPRPAQLSHLGSAAPARIAPAGAVICCAERACRTAPIGVPSAAATSPSSPIFMRHLPKQAKQT